MATNCVFTTLKRAPGVFDQVKVLEHFLELKEDGIYGPVVEASVKAWQGKHGLLQDGIAGPVTCQAMGIWCTKPSPVIGSDAWVKWVIEQMSGIIIKTKEDLYYITKQKGVYADFYDLVHSKIDAVKIYAWKGGINCAEWCEYVAKPILNALGYVIGKDYWIAHCYVTCGDGHQYGHYFIIFSNGFKLNTRLTPINPKFYDLAGAAEMGRPQGTLICPEGAVIIDRYMTDISS